MASSSLHGHRHISLWHVEKHRQHSTFMLPFPSILRGTSSNFYNTPYITAILHQDMLQCRSPGGPGRKTHKETPRETNIRKCTVIQVELLTPMTSPPLAEEVIDDGHPDLLLCALQTTSLLHSPTPLPGGTLGMAYITSLWQAHTVSFHF